jgi:hypothetical protein
MVMSWKKMNLDVDVINLLLDKENILNNILPLATVLTHGWGVTLMRANCGKLAPLLGEELRLKKKKLATRQWIS